MEQQLLPAIKHDGKIAIATGASRRDMRWRNRETTWSALVRRLSEPQRTPETMAEYRAMSKTQQGDVKDVGGFVGGTLKGGRRQAGSVAWRRLITLDLDNVPEQTDPWPTVTLALGYAAVLYSTHSHMPEAPRLRLIVPLSREVTADEYAALSRRLAGDIGIDLCDDTTYEPSRLMYWPSCPQDAAYRFEYNDGPWMDVDEQLARYADWRDPTQWPWSDRRKIEIKRAATKQGDPTLKTGPIGAFCRAYSIEAAIDEFLPGIYAPASPGRYTYVGGSTVGGLVIYERGKFAYSHHGTDPTSGRLCNAFDLVRLHLYGDRDDEAAPGTPQSRMPSMLAMMDMALRRPEIRQALAEEQTKTVMAAFDAADAEGQPAVEPPSTDWMRALSMTNKGRIEDTRDNALTILRNDPNLKDGFALDQFRGRTVVLRSLPWRKLKERGGNGWDDTDDAGLRTYLETTYGLTSINKVQDALLVARDANAFHPVRDYLNALRWDGELRLDELLITLLGAEDSPYVRAVTRKALIGAVARIFRPGCKHDHMLVLVGPQGSGKSTLLSRLGGAWYSDSMYTVQGKDAYELLQGAWIIEMGEMAAFKKADIEAIKQFISKQADIYRAAYGRNIEEHPRQCAFFGSTNDTEFLHDQTGNRRFWPVDVRPNDGRVWAELTPEYVGQVWAEAVVAYGNGEAWHLDRELEAEALTRQEAHTEASARIGIIEQYLDTPLPSGWADMDLPDRRAYLDNSLIGAPKGNVTRTDVSTIAIFCEALGGRIENYKPSDGREINAIMRKMDGWKETSMVPADKLYGRQRGFRRDIWATKGATDG